MNNWKNSKVSERLGLSAPIIQGPFGGGLSSVDLVAAVCEAGGLGSFGMYHLSAEEIHSTTHAIRQKTNRPFALNLWIPFENSDASVISEQEFGEYLKPLIPYFNELGLSLPTVPQRYIPRFDEQIEAVLACRPAVFSFVFGIPKPDILGRCRELGIATLGTATTVEEALALEQAGVDMIVATGAEAGGHRVSFLRSAEDSLIGTFALIPQVVDAVRIPVIAAGGIADGRGVAAAFALGAQAAQIGTAFLGCKESGTSDIHRQKLFSKDASHTALTRAFSGRLGRGIRNRYMDDFAAHQDSIAPFPIQNWLNGKLRKAATEAGREDLMCMWSGQAAALMVHHDAATLFRTLVRDTEARLKTFN
jgi:nitronate monooxygenase